MIIIKDPKRSYGISFPTSVDEFTKIQIESIVDGIKLPKHYCIIAMAYSTRVFDFVTMLSSRSSSNVAVVPILAKIDEEDIETVRAEVGDRIVIDRSSLERGVHINIKTSISVDSAKRYFNNSPGFVKDIIGANNANTYEYKVKDSNIILLEFKIVPVTDISASIAREHYHKDIFLFREDTADEAKAN